MAKNRTKTNLVHNSNGEQHRVSREKATGKLFIHNTTTEVPSNQVSKQGGNSSGYDFSKPSQAQDLGDEWSDYAWSGDDY